MSRTGVRDLRGVGDGSVHFVPTSTDPDVFVSLLTCNGGDVVGVDAF